MKILTVEDDNIIREGISEYLSEFGYTVIQAKDGREALSKFNSDINLVILDIQIPFINGLEVLKEIRKKSNLPILILTESNDERAALLRKDLKDKGVFLLNLMSSPGAGKTTTLTRTIEQLKDDLRIGVMEADIDSDVDAITIAETGAKAIQLHTGGMCHLDADMTRQGIDELDDSDIDLVVLENVGNLVCPAEFDTGAVKNVMILSVPEGDDKPLKYPLMFSVCDVVLINKIDVMEYLILILNSAGNISEEEILMLR